MLPGGGGAALTPHSPVAVQGPSDHGGGRIADAEQSTLDPEPGSPALDELGWTAAFAEHFRPHRERGLEPARVAVEHRSIFDLYTADGEAEAALAGRLRHETRNRLDLPAVGDWVAVSRPSGGGQSTIEAVLPRASVFTRRAAGRDHRDQIIASNIDVALVVTSLNAELSARRLERYMTLAWESGARPAIVLSKADLCADPAPWVREVETVAAGVPVLVTSARDQGSMDALRALLLPNRTGALLGSSGVGKSTLINALVGSERQATGTVREADDKGRHTTTRRELVLLPGGGLLIDTPGMRELQLAEAGHGLLSAFDDIESLAAQCAFGDCTHGPEPDCAVKAAVADGRLDRARLESFHKLVRELAHRSAWDDKRAGAGARKKDRAANKALRQVIKKKRG